MADDDSTACGPIYAFRYALVQQGACAMLTSEDRVFGHRLAGRWLEESGHSVPATLAGHYAPWLAPQ